MKVIKIVKEYEYIYIAKDGTKWNNETLCKEYEQLLKDPTPIKSLKFFDSKGNSIDIFALREIPHFCYLVIEKAEIRHYNWEVIKRLIKNESNDERSYELPRNKGIYLNDWSNLYSGFYNRSNGWNQQTIDIKGLELELENLQAKVELFRKFTK